MNNIQSIKYITAFAKTNHKWKYYLNNNFKNSHTLKTELLRKFILELTDNKFAFELNKFFSVFQSFFVDIVNLKIVKITIDLKKVKENWVNNFWKKENNIDNNFKKYSTLVDQQSNTSYIISGVKENDDLVDKLFKF